MTVDEEIRREARRALLGAIRRYRLTLEASERITIRAADPEASASDDAQKADWDRLRASSDDAWDMAEVALAGAIERLYDVLAPRGRRAREDTSPWFVPRAVRHRGWLYILTSHQDDFDSRHRVVAVLREGMVVGLGRRKRA